VPFFESIVLFDVMEVVTSDDDGAVHFCGLHNALKNRVIWKINRNTRNDIS